MLLETLPYLANAIAFARVDLRNERGALTLHALDGPLALTSALVGGGAAAACWLLDRPLAAATIALAASAISLNCTIEVRLCVASAVKVRPLGRGAGARRQTELRRLVFFLWSTQVFDGVATLDLDGWGDEIDPLTLVLRCGAINPTHSAPSLIERELGWVLTKADCARAEAIVARWTAESVHAAS